MTLRRTEFGVVGGPWLALACLAAIFACAMVIAPAIANADDTTWICKPRQSDDLCAGTINGTSNPPPGQTPQPLPYTRPANAPVDCFYLYPTVSTQTSDNANLDKDPEIRRVVVQQARMFSSVCKVYAPLYHQVTLNGDQSSYNPSVETAYQSAKSAFEDYLKNYNDGRGFIMIGHSQGAVHTARLIDETVDKKPALRKRFVGAIAPGANIPVPIGKDIGGLYDHVPACSTVGQYGCVTAFSTYNANPGPAAEFSRLDTGYWVYPEPRFDSTKYEAMCTNPALLDGGDGTLLPLVNLDYLTGVPPGPESPAPWLSQPDYYKADCMRDAGSHWLMLTKTNIPGDARPDLGAAVASGSNYHVPEVNLAEGNLLTIAQKQTDSYEASVALRKKLHALKTKLHKSKRKRAANQQKVKALKKRVGKAEGDRSGRLGKKLQRATKKARAETKRIGKLKDRISDVKAELAATT